MAKPPKNLTPREWYVWEIYEAHSADPQRKPAPADDGQQLADKKPHVSAQQVVKGNLAKGVANYTSVAGEKLESSAEYYNWNAWNFIGSGADSARGIYGDAACDYVVPHDGWQPLLDVLDGTCKTPIAASTGAVTV